MYEELVQGWRQTGRGNRINPARDQGLIPTWQIGLEQPRQGNLRRLEQEGYGEHSLVYSCIREKATSFAALKAQVVRANGVVADGHRMTQLLEDPNPGQDGQEFNELLMTQYEAAGNAYVWKVRVSDDPERRAAWATFPVQELRLVRPDYVQIEPGETRATDVFVVRVDGGTVGVGPALRIPRRDMIHIKEPNLLNDFYGLSKLQVLWREGAIDGQMSDFELAFFRNAGVPMGMLSVKGNTSPEEIQAIKGRFRRAYNGVRKWFDLLVLNSDQATYTPMGIPQNQMGMDSTRFRVEARTCSVFGVPPLIVGARVSDKGDAITPDDAEHQFWAETMVPASLRFGRSWKKFLLPEFATTRDNGAEVTYDFRVVRALQEDVSRKLREVVRMVITGAFTVNQALTLVGLPTQTDGDFYVRNGNQVIVTADGTLQPMAPSSAGDTGGAPNLDNPLEGAARLLRSTSRGGAAVLDAVDTEAQAAIAEVERLTIFRRPE